MSNETSQTILERLGAARTAMSEGRIEHAIADIEAVLAMDSTNDDALRMAMELGERDENARLDSMEHTEVSTEKRDSDDDKLLLHLRKARRHLLERQLDLAQAEVTLALLINPMHEQAQMLEQEIQTAAESQKEAERMKSSNSVHAILLTARRYLEREKFELALEEVNAGLKIDFAHPELLWLRNSIVEQIQLQQLRKFQERRNTALLTIREQFAKTEFDAALDSVRRAQLEFPNDTEFATLANEIGHAHTKWIELKQFEQRAAAVNDYVKRARQLLHFDRLDEALQEIALGLVLDPFSQNLKKLENELWELQGKREAARRQEKDQEEKEREFVKVTIHLVAAQEFSMYSQFNRALDEITHAYIIDPLNPEIRQLETRIRLQYQRSVATPLKLVYNNDQVAHGH